MLDNKNSDENEHHKRKIFLVFSLATLLVAAITVAAVVGSRKNEGGGGSAQAIVKSTCAATLYPELCMSTIAAVPEAFSSIKSRKDVLMTALNYTITTVQHNYFTVKKLAAKRKSLTVREKSALHDCLEMIDDTLNELHESEDELKNYGSKNYSLSDYVDNLKTLLSAAQTNQESCLDGFSHDGADKRVRSALLKGQMHVFRLVSNVLAMIKNITDAQMAGNGDSFVERKLGEENEHEWPKWLSAGDRRLLQASTVMPDVTVAADGSGNYRTISSAVAAAPERSTRRYIIRIRAGVYRENVEIPRRKTNLMFVGDGRMTTIITASLNVVDGSTTFNSATVAVVGDGFLARDITFQNNAGPSKQQAVALRVNADLSAFYRCSMLAYQDTLYVHSLRQFYVNCIIAGTIDFIFGNAAVVLQNCDIQARLPNSGQRNMVTAQGRDDPNQNTGIVIQRCRIRATSDLQAVNGRVETYLGRPWREYSRTVIMQSDISDIVHPAGWYEWDGNFALNTLFYAEYQNTGAGSGTSNRVTWRGFRVLTSTTEAQPFTAGRFISGGSWLEATGFPFSLGL
ncbi:pectinesterase-like isoform X2 [Olea europaea var. sylvestris]|uniref:pectinesterase-like isoform X1 n=1 Tax=Olea europaea var. sylvestris TaxID=158386 RepID=UPI000C1CDFE9|nr:pectinesterase-like isoform X1 [Olea europaea var. sylvestris]XP_022852276.1 pectinesterase-like isoform X2 [Olea europaea var. sylvestris]